MKHPWPAIIIIGLALLALFALDRSCVADRELAQAKADYEEQVRILEADNALKLDAIAAAERAIAQKDAQISASGIVIATKDRQITLLRSELAVIVVQEPPTTPEVESLPIVINLRAQVSRLTEMFSLSEAARAEQDKVIASWRDKYEAQVTISVAWKAQAENEHTLRVQAESLFKIYEHQRKMNIWKFVGYTAGAFALGYVIGK